MNNTKNCNLWRTKFWTDKTFSLVAHSMEILDTIKLFRQYTTAGVIIFASYLLLIIVTLSDPKKFKCRSKSRHVLTPLLFFYGAGVGGFKKNIILEVSNVSKLSTLVFTLRLQT